jgi:hypothetical protein
MLPFFLQCKLPNFQRDGVFYLVRCFNCGGKKGKENIAPFLQRGVCAFCGWSKDKSDKLEKFYKKVIVTQKELSFK